MSRLFVDPFREGYMQRALLEVLLLSLVGGVVSVHVLLRRLAFAGDALTHTVFPGVAIAFVAGRSVFAGALVFGLLSAVLLTFATRIPRIDSDAALGVLVGAFFSVGVVVVSTQRAYASDLTALLFGRILTVDRGELIETALVVVVVLAVLAVLHKPLVLWAFDPTGAEALGYRVVLLDLALNAAIALVVVAAARSVGTGLVIALVVVPAATARLLVDRVGALMAAAVGITALCGYVGLAASYEASLHHGVRLGSGATIVLTLTIAFALVAVGTAAKRRLAVRR
jgi:ABC-type Mn2+/Zn2+ transport system permease subunit